MQWIGRCFGVHSRLTGGERSKGEGISDPLASDSRPDSAVDHAAFLRRFQSGWRHSSSFRQAPSAQLSTTSIHVAASPASVSSGSGIQWCVAAACTVQLALPETGGSRRRVAPGGLLLCPDAGDSSAPPLRACVIWVAADSSAAGAGAGAGAVRALSRESSGVGSPAVSRAGPAAAKRVVPSPPAQAVESWQRIVEELAGRDGAFLEALQQAARAAHRGTYCAVKHKLARGATHSSLPGSGAASIEISTCALKLEAGGRCPGLLLLLRCHLRAGPAGQLGSGASPFVLAASGAGGGGGGGGQQPGDPDVSVRGLVRGPSQPPSLASGGGGRPLSPSRSANSRRAASWRALLAGSKHSSGGAAGSGGARPASGTAAERTLSPPAAVLALAAAAVAGSQPSVTARLQDPAARTQSVTTARARLAAAARMVAAEVLPASVIVLKYGRGYALEEVAYLNGRAREFLCLSQPDDSPLGTGQLLSPPPDALHGLSARGLLAAVLQHEQPHIARQLHRAAASDRGFGATIQVPAFIDAGSLAAAAAANGNGGGGGDSEEPSEWETDSGCSADHGAHGLHASDAGAGVCSRGLGRDGTAGESGGGGVLSCEGGGGDIDAEEAQRTTLHTISDVSEQSEVSGAAATGGGEASGGGAARSRSYAYERMTSGRMGSAGLDTSLPLAGRAQSMRPVRRALGLGLGSGRTDTGGRGRRYSVRRSIEVYPSEYLGAELRGLSRAVLSLHGDLLRPSSAAAAAGGVLPLVTASAGAPPPASSSFASPRPSGSAQRSLRPPPPPGASAAGQAWLGSGARGSSVGGPQTGRSPGRQRPESLAASGLSGRRLRSMLVEAAVPPAAAALDAGEQELLRRLASSRPFPGSSRPASVVSSRANSTTLAQTFAPQQQQPLMRAPQVQQRRRGSGRWHASGEGGAAREAAAPLGPDPGPATASLTCLQNTQPMDEAPPAVPTATSAHVALGNAAIAALAAGSAHVITGQLVLRQRKTLLRREKTMGLGHMAKLLASAHESGLDDSGGDGGGLVAGAAPSPPSECPASAAPVHAGRSGAGSGAGGHSIDTEHLISQDMLVPIFDSRYGRAALDADFAASGAAAGAAASIVASGGGSGDIGFVAGARAGVPSGGALAASGAAVEAAAPRGIEDKRLCGASGGHVLEDASPESRPAEWPQDKPQFGSLVVVDASPSTTTRHSCFESSSGPDAAATPLVTWAASVPVSATATADRVAAPSPPMSPAALSLLHRAYRTEYDARRAPMQRSPLSMSFSGFLASCTTVAAAPRSARPSAFPSAAAAAAQLGQSRKLTTDRPPLLARQLSWREPALHRAANSTGQLQVSLHRTRSSVSRAWAARAGGPPASLPLLPPAGAAAEDQVEEEGGVPCRAEDVQAAPIDDAQGDGMQAPEPPQPAAGTEPLDRDLTHCSRSGNSVSSDWAVALPPESVGDSMGNATATTPALLATGAMDHSGWVLGPPSGDCGARSLRSMGSGLGGLASGGSLSGAGGPPRLHQMLLPVMQTRTPSRSRLSVELPRPHAPHVHGGAVPAAATPGSCCSTGVNLTVAAATPAVVAAVVPPLPPQPQPAVLLAAGGRRCAAGAGTGGADERRTADASTVRRNALEQACILHTASAHYPHHQHQQQRHQHQRHSGPNSLPTAAGCFGDGGGGSAAADGSFDMLRVTSGSNVLPGVGAGAFTSSGMGTMPGSSARGAGGAGPASFDMAFRGAGAPRLNPPGAVVSDARGQTAGQMGSLPSSSSYGSMASGAPGSGAATSGYFPAARGGGVAGGPPGMARAASKRVNSVRARVHALLDLAEQAEMRRAGSSGGMQSAFSGHLSAIPPHSQALLQATLPAFSVASGGSNAAGGGGGGGPPMGTLCGFFSGTVPSAAPPSPRQLSLTAGGSGDGVSTAGGGSNGDGTTASGAGGAGRTASQPLPAPASQQAVANGDAAAVGGSSVGAAGGTACGSTAEQRLQNSEPLAATSTTTASANFLLTSLGPCVPPVLPAGAAASAGSSGMPLGTVSVLSTANLTTALENSSGARTVPAFWADSAATGSRWPTEYGTLGMAAAAAGSGGRGSAMHGGTSAVAATAPDPTLAGPATAPVSAPMAAGVGPGPVCQVPKAWCQLRARACTTMDGRRVLVLMLMDVTRQVQARERVAALVEQEHRILEALFPRHVIAYLTAPAASSIDEEAAGAVVAGGGSVHASTGVGSGGGSGRSRRGPGARAAAAALSGGGSGLERTRSLMSSTAGGGVTAADSVARGQRQLRQLAMQQQQAALRVAQLATSHRMVTILFSDIVGFTAFSRQVPPLTVMRLLNELYKKLDAMLDIYKVYKVETIGDCYVVAGGLVRYDSDGLCTVLPEGEVDELHAVRVMQFAKAMLRASRTVTLPITGQPLQLRLGLHSGPAMSGVVGSKMPRFTVFGETVELAHRMEAAGTPGRIHVSGATRALLGSEAWQATEGVEVAGRGTLDTYLWVEEAEEDEGHKQRVMDVYL